MWGGCLSLVFTSDASISTCASIRIKICPFSCACAYACVRLRCVKTEHYACACVASENQALPETENKILCQTSCLKTGRGHVRNLVVSFESALVTVFDLETKQLFTKWSLTAGVHLWEVLAMRELTVLTWLFKSCHLGTERVKIFLQ